MTSAGSSFEILRRRNEHRRFGMTFLYDLANSVGIPRESVELLPAEASISQWQELDALLPAGVASGLVVRTTMTAAQASSMWESFLNRHASARLHLFLNNSEDFPVSVRGAELRGRLERLIDFDGDTVTAVTSDLASGVAVDVTDGPGGKVFEVDTWPSSSGPLQA